MRYFLFLLIFVLANSVSRAAEHNCDGIAQEFVKLPAPPYRSEHYGIYKKTLEVIHGEADVVVLGDSIAELWPADTITAIRAGSKVVNLGVRSDRVQNTLWRLHQYQAAGMTLMPSLVILTVGTNNLGEMPPCAIAEGTIGLVHEVAAVWPKARIILLKILPRGVDFAAFADERREITSDLIATLPANTSLVDVDSAVSCEGADSFGFWYRLKGTFGPVESPCANYRDDLLHLTRAGYASLGGYLQANGLLQ